MSARDRSMPRRQGRLILRRVFERDARSAAPSAAHTLRAAGLFADTRGESRILHCVEDRPAPEALAACPPLMTQWPVIGPI
jgi:hypothetical protein